MKNELEAYRKKGQAQMNKEIATIKLETQNEEFTKGKVQAQEEMKIEAERNTTANLQNDHVLKVKNLEEKYRIEKQRLDTELEKKNIHKDLLVYEAIKTAEECYRGKYMSTTRITSMDTDDAASAVITGLVSKQSTSKKALGV